MDAQSAMPHRVKIASMTQEGVRRLCNCSRELDLGAKCEIMSKFMRKLQISGYGQATRANILEGAVSTFRKKERAETLGLRPIHRLSSHNEEQRRRAKLTGKRDWYKPGRANWKKQLQLLEKSLKDQDHGGPSDSNIKETKDPRPHQPGPSNENPEGLGQPRTRTTAPGPPRARPAAPGMAPQGPSPTMAPNSRTEGILFVPHTPGGALSKALQKAEDTFAKLHNIARVRVVERGGAKLMDLMGRKDPWSPTNCCREDCMTCKSKDKKEGSPMTCQKESVCYMLSCDRCKAKGCKAEYCGESARTTYLRGLEHSQDHQKSLEDNALHKHDVLHHAGEVGTYSMRVLRQHRKPLARQMQEATQIENSDANIIMNSKCEYNGSRVPRVTMEMGGYSYSEEYKGGEGQQTILQQRSQGPRVSDRRTCIPKEAGAAKSVPWSPNGGLGAVPSLRNPRTNPKDNQDLDPEVARARDRARGVLAWEEKVRSKARTKPPQKATKRTREDHDMGKDLGKVMRVTPIKDQQPAKVLTRSPDMSNPPPLAQNKVPNSTSAPQTLDIGVPRSSPPLWQGQTP